jgi:phenylpropionate dioxygenase-like ring-hydroxylating dioxygenase large terminal subunit
MTLYMKDADVVDRIFNHIDGKTTDIGNEIWREPVENYDSQERFDAEIELLRRLPVPFCPSAALPEKGSYVARTAAKTPLLAVRGDDGVVRAFHNTCRHRGMAVAEGSGSARTFVCPYHSWAYGLDGALKHIPGEDGFPGLDYEKHGLVQVIAEERNGIVFVTQKDPVSEGPLNALPELFTPDQVAFNKIEVVDQANWKLIGETSMEGYHIKSLHNKSFYPYGLDNINVVETHGTNSRIVFPFRRIEKLRDIPRNQQRLGGMVTDVYQLFPNTHISMLSSHSMLIILEPVSPGETRWEIFQIKNRKIGDKEINLEEAKRDAEFVNDTGLKEDRDAACSIHAGILGNANSHFTFGKFEKAIVHFHKNLNEHLAMLT